MYDPDQLKKTLDAKLRKEQVRHPVREAGSPYEAPTLLSEKERLRYYLINDIGTRSYFGFAISAESGSKRLIIADVKKLERLPYELKQMLRELYQELK